MDFLSKIQSKNIKSLYGNVDIKDDGIVNKRELYECMHNIDKKTEIREKLNIFEEEDINHNR